MQNLNLQGHSPSMLPMSHCCCHAMGFCGTLFVAATLQYHCSLFHPLASTALLCHPLAIELHPFAWVTYVPCPITNQVILFMSPPPRSSHAHPPLTDTHHNKVRLCVPPAPPNRPPPRLNPSPLGTLPCPQTPWYTRPGYAYIRLPPNQARLCAFPLQTLPLPPPSPLPPKTPHSA